LGLMGIPEILILLLGIFWVWMLIDCATNEPAGTEKIVWILILLFGGCVGAPIYFFVRRSKRMSL
jgi:hypothetical protein